MLSTVGGVSVPTPIWKLQLQVNWYTDGWREDYYHSGGNLADVIKLVGGGAAGAVVTDSFLGARLSLMLANSNLYVYGVRISPVANTGAVGTTLVRGPWPGFYTKEGSSTTGPWDAADLYFPLAGGSHKSQEMRGIPNSIANFFGGNQLPSSAWVGLVPKFQDWLQKNSFGVLSSAIQPATTTFPVVSIVPNVGNPLPQPTLPAGVLLVTATGSNIPINTAQRVKFSQVRTKPRLNPSHVAIGIDGANLFYLKNTDFGSLQYQPSSGRVFLANPSFVAYQTSANGPAFISKSGSKKPGRPFGGTTGRRTASR